MALTLPYPDLDFVPLDVLTAEELNEIVANYTYISNQFPLTSDKLDWTTDYSGTFQNVSVASRTGVNAASINIPAGSIAIISGYIEFSANSTGTREAALYLGSSLINACRVPAASGEVIRGSVSAVVAPSTDTAVNLRAYQTSGDTLNASGRITYAILR